MRPLLMLSLVLCVSACSTDPHVAFEHRATIQAGALGMVLSDGGRAAWLGMDEQVCVVEIGGGVNLEVDPGPGAEHLLDAVGQRALIATPEGVVEVGADGTTRSVVQRAVRAAHLLADGSIVAVVEHEGGCALATQTETWALPGTRCDGGIDTAVDRVRGTTWIADGRALTVVEPDGRFVRLDAFPVDRVAFDRVTGRVLVASIGGSTVSEISPDGSVAWVHELNGRVHDADLAGAAGIAAVMIEQQGSASLELLDSREGTALARHPLPELADVVASDDGRTLALVVDGATHVYDVNPSTHFSLPASSDAAGLHPWAGLAATVGGSGAAAGIGIALGAVLID